MLQIELLQLKAFQSNNEASSQAPLQWSLTTKVDSEMSSDFARHEKRKQFNCTLIQNGITSYMR